MSRHRDIARTYGLQLRGYPDIERTSLAAEAAMRLGQTLHSCQKHSAALPVAVAQSATARAHLSPVACRPARPFNAFGAPTNPPLTPLCGGCRADRDITVPSLIGW